MYFALSARAFSAGSENQHSHAYSIQKGLILYGLIFGIKILFKKNIQSVNVNNKNPTNNCLFYSNITLK